jgi:DNA polymerase
MPTTPQVLIWDVESYSKLDLKKAGAWRYASNISTGIWCVYFCAGDGDIQGWRPGEPVPTEILEAASNPGWVFAAFNAGFERLILQHILIPRHGWPLVPLEQYRCLQASASMHALPADLKGVGEVLKLDVQKDAAGRRLMLKLAKIEDPASVDPDMLQELYKYCERDVATERELYRKLGFLPDSEQAIWMRDQAINDRGIHIDRPLVTTAKRIVEQARANLDKELCEITDGAVESVHQCSRLQHWLADNGCQVETVGRTALRKALTRNGLSEKVQRAINIRLSGAHASASKLDAMLNWINPDDRVRGCFKYYGASTGRWTSYGIQLQNLKKPNGADMDALIALVSTGDFEQVRASNLEPVSAVGDLTRAMIAAAPGHRFLIGDFSGIESRVLAWLAGQTDKLELWVNFDRTGRLEDDVYYRLGLKFGFTSERGYASEQTRALGKICDLAFGYMGGEGAWRNLSPDDGLPAEQIKAHQQAWRAAHPYVVALWKALDNAAIRAVQNPSKVIKLPRQAWQWGSFISDGTFLHMSLPSGRSLAYPFPELKTGKFDNPVVSFKDVTLGKWGDCRHGAGSYGGVWIENAVQAVARDILAQAMLRLEAAGYHIVLHVHDEIVAEVPDGFGNIEEFQKLITTPPAWATDLPLAAAARSGPRFAKASISGQPQTVDQPCPEMPEKIACDQGFETPKNEGDHPQEEEEEPTEEPADEYPHGERDTGHQLAFFVYRHANNQPYLGVKKTSTKQFPQFHWTGHGWTVGPPRGPKIPYRLPELVNAPLNAWVLICAGEKDADTAASLGFIATTNPEGERKGAWAPELNAWFYGRPVAIMEDNDETGRAHVVEVAEALRGKASEIRIITFRDMPAKGDLTDWVQQGHGYPELLTKIEATKSHCRRPRPSPIRQWDGEPVPDLEYAVPDRFPLENVGLFSGEGGQGKSSLIQQLCVAHPLGREWLGCTPRCRPAVYIECEDAEHVLRWRLAAIAVHYKVTLSAIADGGFQMYALNDEENTVLATSPDKSGIVRPTPLYDWLYELAGDIKPVMIGIASSANVFAGNENVRTEVQQFIRLLRRIACVAHGTVLLVTQPSLSGIDHKSASHEGLAGTTQWHNAVRARAVMSSVKQEDGVDTGLRQVKFHKNQYGPPSAACFVRYESGLFLPVEGMSMDAAERAAKAEEAFVTLLRKFTAQKQMVSPNPSSTYAPARFAEQSEAQGISKKEFARAMQRLLDIKTIEIRTWGKPSKPIRYLAIVGEG